MSRLVPSAVLFLSLTACSANDELGQDGDSFTFTLDFWAASDSEGREALTDQHVLANGSEVGLVLDPGRSHVYLLYQDTAGALEVLYSSQDQHDGAISLLAPGAVLDDQDGHERFCVIAATERLPRLEEAITEYRTRPEEAKALLLAQLSELRDQYESQECEPPRPVTIGGQVRGGPNSPPPTAREYPVVGVRCQMITLEHR